MVFAMEILLAILGVAAFAACLWGSILCCVSRGCCGSTPVTVFPVSCLALLSHMYIWQLRVRQLTMTVEK